MGGSVKDVKSKAEVDAVVGGGSPVVLHFWASWCEASKHMDQLFTHLSTDFPKAHFLRVTFHSQILFFSTLVSLSLHLYHVLQVEAEEQPEISEAYSVSAVPFFVFCKVMLLVIMSSFTRKMCSWFSTTFLLDCFVLIVICDAI